MFYKYLIVIAMLFINSDSVELLDNKIKRSEIDLQTCIDNFDIHKDKIIRTQDSRAMGAKYLNEIDLDSREECLRLCCETENCDVFVYEEKNAGSCYLFQCGPPEDFKCKFTHHVNYTSAVLAVNRHLPDLESQIKLTKHEQDLTKLRKPEVVNTGSVQMVPAAQTTQSTATTTVKIKDVINSLRTKSPTENRKCSIYQFECRSTGECIAIYNACDGIPQCADGSDEAPELRCPDTQTAVAAGAPPPPPIPAQNQANNAAPRLMAVPLENQPARLQPLQNAQQSQEIYRPPISQHVPQFPAAPRREPDYMRPNVDPSNPAAPHIPQYDPQQIPQYPPYGLTQSNWNQHQPNQMQPQIPPYADNKNSHIFNHKESGLQVSDVGETSPLQYGDNREYPNKLSNYYGSEVYRQPIPQLQENWPNNQQEDFRNVNNNPYAPGGRETWRQNIPVQTNQDKSVQVKELPASWKIESAIPKHEQDKMAHELKHTKDHIDNSTNKEAKNGNHVHSENDGHDHGKYAVVAEYKIAAEIEAIEDGVAETPGGAVLSLTLGLIITSLMAILIGCRLRVVRRRMRRGGKSYAHDADYLVNGMYL